MAIFGIFFDNNVCNRKRSTYLKGFFKTSSKSRIIKLLVKSRSNTPPPFTCKPLIFKPLPPCYNPWSDNIWAEKESIFDMEFRSYLCRNVQTFYTECIMWVDLSIKSEQNLYITTPTFIQRRDKLYRKG